MKNSKLNSDEYPTTGTLLEKIKFLEEKEFKTMWKVKAMRRALQKRNDGDLADTLSFFVGVTTGTLLFMIQFDQTVSQSYFTTNYKWLKDGENFLVLVAKPANSHFLKLSTAGRKYTFSHPPKELTGGKFDINATCHFLIGEGVPY